MKRQNNPKTDEEVINQLRAPNERENNQVLEYLYIRLYAQVERYITKNSGVMDDVNDIFQDGLIAFYKLVKRGSIDKSTNVEAYIFGICRNLWLKQLKKNKREIALSDDHQVIPVEDVQLLTILNGNQSKNLKEILGQLGAACQQILIYYYYERLRMVEIAQRMELSNEQVAKNKKSRCLKKLRELINSNAWSKDDFLNS